MCAFERSEKGMEFNMAFASMFIFQFLVFSVVAIIVFIIYILIKIAFYIFQSIGLYKISKMNGYKYPIIAWIPCVSQYIIGKFNKSSKLGVLYSILTIMKYLAIILLFNSNNFILFNLYLVYFVIYFVLDVFIMDRFYTKVFENPNIYTIITTYTFGFVKPIFIFMARYKLKNNNV